MIILPAIDLKDGQCVRLHKGDFGTVHSVAEDPVCVAAKYREQGASMVHVVDLDGAKDGKRTNSDLVAAIVVAAHPAKIELGGGLRTEEDLRDADALGVYRFVLGSVAVENPEFVSRAIQLFGADRIAVGIDALDGLVKTRGWIEDGQIRDIELARGMRERGVKTLIYTDISKDGELKGPSFDRLAAMQKAFGGNVVASGGVTTPEDVAKLRDMKMAGCIIGKALYSGSITLREAIFRGQWEMCFEKDELLPAIIQDVDSGQVLMLGYMNAESLRKTLDTGHVTFFSRSRHKLWEKGETSGHYLRLKSISPDCDKDTLLIQAEPIGPTCHTGNKSCFYETWEVR